MMDTIFETLTIKITSRLDIVSLKNGIDSMLFSNLDEGKCREESFLIALEKLFSSLHFPSPKEDIFAIQFLRYKNQKSRAF